MRRFREHLFEPIRQPLGKRIADHHNRLCRRRLRLARRRWLDGFVHLLPPIRGVRIVGSIRIGRAAVAPKRTRGIIPIGPSAVVPKIAKLRALECPNLIERQVRGRIGRPLVWQALSLRPSMEASMQAAGELSPLAHFRQIFSAASPVSSRAGAKHTMLANNVNLTIFGGGAANKLCRSKSAGPSGDHLCRLNFRALLFHRLTPLSQRFIDRLLSLSHFAPLAGHLAIAAPGPADWRLRARSSARTHPPSADMISGPVSSRDDSSGSAPMLTSPCVYAAGSISTPKYLWASHVSTPAAINGESALLASTGAALR